MLQNHSNKVSASKLFLTLLVVLQTLTASAGEKFGMDESANAAFNPMYSYLILAGVFVLAIVVYLVFKPKEKKNSHQPPVRNSNRTGPSRDPRRRPVQKPR